MHETVAHEAESEKRVVVVVSVVAKKRVAGRLSKHQAFPPRSVQEQHLPNPPMRGWRTHGANRSGSGEC